MKNPFRCGNVVSHGTGERLIRLDQAGLDPTHDLYLLREQLSGTDDESPPPFLA
jgi:hypothetical protein